MYNKEMYKFITLALAILVLTACSSGNNQSKPKIPRQSTVSSVDSVKAPKIPKISNTTNKEKNIDLGTVLKEIDKNISPENITRLDIEKGWYYAKTKNNKKVGTPSSWMWKNDETSPRWVSPVYTKEGGDNKVDELCKKTAGTYTISCIESEVASCEHIPKSKCACTYGSKWTDEEGCVKTKDNQFVKISSEELKQGWYYGLKNEKKSGTPKSWTWTESGKQSKWHTAVTKDVKK